MSRVRAFVGLGSNTPDARGQLLRALAGLEAHAVRVAAVAVPVAGPYVGADGRPETGAPPVLNSVAEVGAGAGPEALLALLLTLEQQAGRQRDGGPVRALDLDLLAYGGEQRAGAGLVLPHPRARARAFVLEPWAEVAPGFVLPDGASVLAARARARAADPGAFAVLQRQAPLELPGAGPRPAVLSGPAQLSAWRARAADAGREVLLVPTMGALHAGHAALVRRARAHGGAVLATIFVNPLQFGPSEDLARYPRTLEADLDVLAAAGADAVYAPAAGDLYPPGFATHVVPGGPAEGFEGALRPGHFRGVATVVLKLLLRSGAARAWFGQKDAQQVAVLQRMAADLDLPVALEVAPIVRDADGLALSSRNRYLSAAERARALALPEALAEAERAAALGVTEAGALLSPLRARLLAAGLTVDYAALVHPGALTPVERLGPAPALLLATVRAGATRLLDNRLLLAP